MSKQIKGNISDESHEYLLQVFNDLLDNINQTEEQINFMYRFNTPMLTDELAKINKRKEAIIEIKTILESSNEKIEKIKIEDIEEPTIEEVKVNKKSKK